MLKKVFLLKSIITKLNKLLNHRQKVNMGILISLTIGFSLIETLGISAIMPFISLASNPCLLESGVYNKIFNFFKFSNFQAFIIILGIAIICFYIFRAIYSMLLTWISSRYTSNVYKYFSTKVFKTNLSVSYKVYTQKNSAVLMQSITSETMEISKISSYLLQICSDFFTVLLIYMLILFLNWKMTLIITAILLLIVIFLLSFITKISKAQGTKRINASRKMNRTLLETFGNIKFLKLKGNKDEVLKKYDSLMKNRIKADVIYNVLGIIPKNILESLGFSFLVGVVVFIIWVYKDASKVIPVISMYALALYRILPSVHHLLGNINHIAYSEKGLEYVYESLHQETVNEGTVPLEFNNSIQLENINFKYIIGNEVLKDINLTIKKGEKIAFTGESGGGKTTLIDIITGIHKPNSGKLIIDNIEITDENVSSWRKKIGYIPQNVYLFDGTVGENISFGSVPDEEKMIIALKKANIWDFLSEKEGINTHVGENGIQLSGGQQQRIGIARALYDDPEILVLDEATSSLDNETEQKIMNEIYDVSKNKTLLIIAHRLSTVERCERKIQIENGKISTGTSIE